MATAVDTVPCPACTDGSFTVKVIEKGVEKAPLVMKCPTCKGTRKVTRKQAREYKAYQEMWCRCEDPGDGIYHPDTRKMKHHWTCSKCGKVTQIG